MQYYFLNYFIITNCNLKSQAKSSPKIPMIVAYLNMKKMRINTPLSFDSLNWIELFKPCFVHSILKPLNKN